MFTTAKSLHGMELQARDGVIGTIKDLLLDDHDWAVRYLVVSTAHWLPRHHVLIPAAELDSFITTDRHLAIDLSKEAVRHSPPIDTVSISHRQENDLHRHFGWTGYWAELGVGAGRLVDPAAVPAAAAFRANASSGRAFENESVTDGAMADAERSEAESHLRSAWTLRGYHIEAKDGPIGHLDDLVIDPLTWRIPYFLVDTRNWWPGEKVTLGTAHLREIDWSGSKLWLDVTRDTIKGAPHFDGAFRADYFARLRDHYGAK